MPWSPLPLWGMVQLSWLVGELSLGKQSGTVPSGPQEVAMTLLCAVAWCGDGVGWELMGDAG